MGHDTYLFYHPELDAVVAVEFTKPHYSGRDAMQPRPSPYARAIQRSSWSASTRKPMLIHRFCSEEASRFSGEENRSRTDRPLENLRGCVHSSLW